MSQHSVPPQQPGYPAPGQPTPPPAPQQGGQGGYAQPGAYPTPSQGYAAPSQGYAQPGAAGQPAPAQQQWGAHPGQPQHPGYGGQYQPVARTEPGFFGRLFDTKFAHLVAPKYVSGAYIAVIIVAGVFTLSGLVNAVNTLSLGASLYGSATTVLSGLVQILVAPAIGLAILLVGRLALEAVTHLASSSASLAALRKDSDGPAE
ncbi:hypothetical protein Bcav_1661 [Beutenbergia cavernae DSM 12333]|uniref:DUF4282 domain-containing protein n=1 Tax=Beutenbergia cavernae (strain ATCC BAA-8 / DSM 12333 / CCUG 43141 / JCM 11478 / NBRC 16432 / NCIMB 13614 / HKI 0122) TaxID=471853 RepID=C5C404_BEUC1|nr:DUF4282 domain-containing protein [Beutenbergia cavernae]ACQ79917.1 hypothetical protein Bcav_1661 [Beutenbergia cavernae DSM 12333]